MYIPINSAITCSSAASTAKALLSVVSTGGAVGVNKTGRLLEIKTFLIICTSFKPFHGNTPSFNK